MTYEGEEPIEVNGKKVVAFKESGEWTIPEGVTNVDVLVVAGGGSTCEFGGGGGAGGLIFRPNYDISQKSNINIQVGAGGIGSTTTSTGTDGENSFFDNLIALGGGAGTSSNEETYANSGGNGGGNGPRNKFGGQGVQPSEDGDSGSPYGFGNNGGGGKPDYTSGNSGGSGGGGGAGESGKDGAFRAGGDGGDGLDEVEINEETYNFADIFGTNYGEIIEEQAWFAGGGAGFGDHRDGSATNGEPGKGGGGLAATNGGTDNTDGLENTGGGAGAGGPGGVGADGGSGIVIIAYEEPSFIIKGKVTLNSTNVEGAKVSCINQNTNELVGHTTSDENGEWEFSDLDEEAKYHVVASLEDGEDKFNHLSFYDLVPKEEEE